MKKKITIKDIAELAGVSTATVSYVINNVGRINEETRKRILKIIEEVGYTPNVTARNLAKQKNNVIGILVSVFKDEKATVLTDNPFFIEFLANAHYKAVEHGYSILITDYSDKNNIKKLINSKAVSGLICLGKFDNKLFQILKEAYVPIVLIDHDYVYDNFYYIYSDDKKGAYLATEYLIKRNHQKIGLICGEIKSSVIHQWRYEGFCKALNDYELEINKDYIFETNLNYRSGISLAEKILPLIGKVTAFFVISDIVTMGLIKGLSKYNVRVPDDLSIVSYDNLQSSKYFIPELTTVNQNIKLKAEMSIDLIVNHFHNAKPTSNIFVLPVDIVEGNSVKII
jgi:LacI family transcriptional regulator